MSDAKEKGQCYNPNCEEHAEWSDGIHESYCSWECAIEARGGKHAD